MVIECQFGGWSGAINRFSWFKRTVKEVYPKLTHEPELPRIRSSLDSFQEFIANVNFPLGVHLTGPMRTEMKKVAGHEQLLLDTLEFGIKRFAGRRCVLDAAHPTTRLRVG